MSESGWTPIIQNYVEFHRLPAVPKARSRRRRHLWPKLSKLITEPGQVFQYVYDFGDNWIHRIEVEDTAVKADPGWIPWLIDGARRGPPEDCGGVPGYQRLIEATTIATRIP